MASSSRGGGSRPLETATHEGEPALLVPRWTRPPRVGRAVLLGLALLAGGGGAWAAARGGAGVAITLGVLALVLVGVVLRDSVAMPYAGGLWLSPTRVTHRLGREEWSLAWEEIGEVSYSGDDLLLEQRGGGERAVRAHLLVTDQRTIGTLVDAFRGDPARRASLGSEDSRRLAEQVRGSVQPPDFRVAVQGAVPSGRRGLFLAALVVAVVVLAIAALGRSTSVDDDELARTLAEQVTVGGEVLEDVSCDGAIRAEAGETQTCTAMVAGRERRVRVTVASVQDDRIDYDVAMEATG